MRKEQSKTRAFAPVPSPTFGLTNRASSHYFIYFTFFLALLAPKIGRAQTLSKACAVFVDVTVVPMNVEHLIPHQDVIIQGEKITAIRPYTPIHLSANCFRIDSRNKFLIPGLTDTHVHFFGYQKLKAGDPHTERVILSMLLANGITTALVMEGTSEVLDLRNQIRDRSLLLPTIFSAGSLIQMSHSGAPPGREAFDTPLQVRAEVLREKRAGYDFIKVHGDLPLDTYRELLRAAKEAKIPVIGHAPPNLGIEATLAGGQLMIAHAESYLDGYFRFHRELPTDAAETREMIREISTKTAHAGVWVQPTLSVFRQINTQLADVNTLLERPETGYLPKAAIADWYPPDNPYVHHWTLANIPEFRAQYALMQLLTKGLEVAGVPLLAGTDDMVPCQLPGFSLKDELEQLTEAGLTPYESLVTATSNPAKFLNTFSNEGTVEVRKNANLVLLEADPLENINNVFRQAGVMLRGHWIPESELQHMLQSSARANANETSEARHHLPL